MVNKKDSSRKNKAIRAKLRSFGTESDKSLMDLFYEIEELLPQPYALLVHMAAYDADSRVSDNAFVMLNEILDAEHTDDDEYEFMCKVVRDDVLEAIKDASIPDGHKLKLFGVYNMVGGEISPEETPKYFNDFEKAYAQLIKNVGDALSDYPESILSAMDYTGLWGEEDVDFLKDYSVKERQELFNVAVDKYAGLYAMAPSATDAVAATCCSIIATAAQYGESPVGAAELLRKIADQRSERATWWMDELSRLPMIGDIGEYARQLVQESKAAGVTPRYTMICEYSHGIITATDPSGARSMYLFFRTPEGGMHTACALAKEKVGMKDVWVAFEAGAEIEENIRQLGKNVPIGQCTFEMARQFVGDLLACHIEMNKPLPGNYMAMRPYLGEAPIVPQRHRPNLGAYMLEMITPTAELLSQSAMMADNNHYAMLWFASDAAWDYVRGLPPRKGRVRQEDVEAFAKAVAPLEREWLMRRLAAYLEIEALAGRATSKVNQTAAVVYKALDDNTIPMHKIPYIIDLCRESIPQIQQSIKAGYANQEAVNQAGLDSESYDENFSSAIKQVMNVLGIDFRNR